MTYDPFLKYVGSKRSLIPQLQPLLPHTAAIRGRYLQPFCGGGSPYWQLYAPRPGSVLSDSNPLLIDTYTAVRDHLDELLGKLRRIEAAGYGKKQYASVRSALNSGHPDLVERAALFLTINAWGFNGLWRVNSRGECNVPMGRTSSGRPPVLCDELRLRACSGALQGVTILCEPFWRTMARASPGDWVYCDPPYMPVSGTSKFVSYTVDGFTYLRPGMEEEHKKTDHHALLCALQTLDDRGVGWALSQADEPTVRRAYEERGWTLHQVRARRAVNSDASKRGPVGELLVTGRVQWAAVAAPAPAELRRERRGKGGSRVVVVDPRQTGWGWV